MSTSQPHTNADLVFREIVNRWGGRKGDAVFADSPGTGQSWTWRETPERMMSTGSVLRSLGSVKVP